MFAFKRIRVLGAIAAFLMLFVAMPVWAEDPMPTDRYDLLPGPSVPPSSLPATGFDRAQQADAARWQGRANQYLGAFPLSLPVTGVILGQQADFSRGQGSADRYLDTYGSPLPTAELSRSQQADAARWEGLAESFAGTRTMR